MPPIPSQPSSSTWGMAASNQRTSPAYPSTSSVHSPAAIVAGTTSANSSFPQPNASPFTSGSAAMDPSTSDHASEITMAQRLSSLQDRLFEQSTSIPDLESASEFPALGGTSRVRPSRMMDPHHQHQQQIRQTYPGTLDEQEEFPSLSSAQSKMAQSSSTIVSEHSQTNQDSTPSSSINHEKNHHESSQTDQDPHEFGLKGLLKIIRMTDPDVNTLSLGTDLTTLGLDLNSSEVLYPLFISPFADSPSSSSEPDYDLPECYYRHPPALKTSHLSKFSLETLFYIFYSMPLDTLQVFACKELYERSWKYHKTLQLWFNQPDKAVMQSLGYKSDSLVYFDTETWERRVYLNDGNSLTFMTEEELKAI